MTFQRGDVALARFPHASGGCGKKRPVVVVQSDSYNSAVRHVVVAEITSNLSGGSDPANLLIDISTSAGRSSGLAHNSIVTCLHLATMSQDRLAGPMGHLDADLLRQLNECLKVVLAIH